MSTIQIKKNLRREITLQIIQKLEVLCGKNKVMKTQVRDLDETLQRFSTQTTKD